jgi:hypothetical protein
MIGSITKSDLIPLPKFGARRPKKFRSFQLHLVSDLCIIMPRPAPRWAKWSRGVRTRGLRVGLVGGPRPFYFFGPGFRSRCSLSSGLTCPLKIARWTLQGSGIIYGTQMVSKLFVLE